MLVDGPGKSDIRAFNMQKQHQAMTHHKQLPGPQNVATRVTRSQEPTHHKK